MEKGSKFFHQNVRSLKEKYDEIREILVHFQKIDIFSLAELLMADTTVADFNVHGYEFVKRCRKKEMVMEWELISSTIVFSIRQDLDDSDIEGI